MDQFRGQVKESNIEVHDDPYGYGPGGPSVQDGLDKIQDAAGPDQTVETEKTIEQERTKDVHYQKYSAAYQIHLGKIKEAPDESKVDVNFVLRRNTSPFIGLLKEVMDMKGQTEGVMILNIPKGSTFDEMDLEVGDVIRELNGERVQSLESFKDFLDGKLTDSDPKIELKIERNGSIVEKRGPIVFRYSKPLRTPTYEALH